MRLLYELSFCLTAFPVLTSARPDLVIGTSPSILSALLARLLAGAARCPLVVVTQDVVSAAAEQTELAVSRTFSKLLAKVESFALRSAALVTVPAPKLRLALGRIGVRPEAIHTIRNWPRRFPTASTADFRARYGWEHRIVIMHTGNIGLKQSLDELVETARLMQVRRPEVVFAIFGHGNQYESLARIAGPIDNIELHPPVPAEDYVALLTSADYLLVHERSTVRDMSLPSKLTSYVQAARPIIAVTHPNSSTASEVRRIGAGVIVPPRDREAFLAALEDLMENVDRREELAMAARSHYGKELSSTPGLSRLAELIANTLSLKSSCTSTHISCSTRPSPTGR